MHTTVDFETRSRVKLKVFGVAVYAMDDSTIALCLAYRVPGERDPRQWIWDGSDKPAIPDALRLLVENDQIEFRAFNAPFERYIWENVCVRKWGWPSLPLERWRCSMARAANANQPQSLDRLTSRLNLEQQKMADGKTLIPLLTEPIRYKKPKKGETIDPNRPEFYPWKATDETCRRFLTYNKQDVKAEEGADICLPEWNPDEVAVWQMDRRMNERGFLVDRKLCVGAARIHKAAVAQANLEIAQLTSGKVTACTQVQRIKKWLIEEKKVNLEAGANGLPTLNEQSLNRWLATQANRDKHPEATQLIELRLFSNSNTVTKYASALNRVGRDDRVRESVRYYGAATGRWTGTGFHPHNFKREAAPAELWFDALATGDYDLVEALADKPGVQGVISVLKQCVRGIITAPRGRKLVTSDFAGIEARVLHWLCDNERMLQLFREDQDIYIAAACDIYDCKPEEIADWNGKKWKIKKEASEKRQLGKQAQLGLGYGMGGPKFVVNVKNKENLIITEDFAAETVAAWRAANEPVVCLWHDVNHFARKIATIPMINKKPAKHTVGRLVFSYWPTPKEAAHGTCVYKVQNKRTGQPQNILDPKGYLTVRLPSGRLLYYHRPRLVGLPGDQRQEFYYTDGSKSTGKGVNADQSKQQAEKDRFSSIKKLLRPGEVKTYGGKLVENIVQAISRDLLVNSLRIIEKAGQGRGFEPIFHVHDESVTEADDAVAAEAHKVVHEAMETVPDWAAGLPLAAETKTTQRYEK